MSTCWHCGHLCFSRPCLCDHRSCQFTDTVNDLPGIKAALPSEAPPVSSREVIAPAFAGDLLSEVLGNILPNLAAHDIVYRCQRYAGCVDHDRVVFGMSVGIAGQ